MKIGFVGLGLIGGSIAKAVREKYPDSRIVAYNRSREPIVQAFRDSVINAATFEIDETFTDCDFIFLCTPVQTNISFLKKLKPYLTEKTILTDVGSTKDSIHGAVALILPDARFIGGHPMAGREKSSYFNSSAGLIRDCYYFITPSKSVKASDVERFENLISSLGCIPVKVDPAEHDYIVGAISHIPHMAAFTLVNLVKDADTSEEHMKQTAAGGFRDITRIASSDPTMWEEICLANKDNLVKLLGEYIDKLREIKSLIREGNGEELHRIFSEAKEYRDSFVDL